MFIKILIFHRQSVSVSHSIYYGLDYCLYTFAGIQKDLSLKFKYRTQSEYRLINKYEQQHIAEVGRSLAADIASGGAHRLPSSITESPRKRRVKGSTGLGRPRLSALARMKQIETTVTIEKDSVQITISPVKSRQTEGTLLFLICGLLYTHDCY